MEFIVELLSTIYLIRNRIYKPIYKPTQGPAHDRWEKFAITAA